MRFPKIRYICRTLHHKWWVFRFGLRTKAPIWRLLIHDWTKFTPAELPAYAARFYGDTYDDLEFAQSWNHHHKANPHHWEYWIPLTTHMLSPVPAGKPLPMPEWAVREMVADWMGAEKSYGGPSPRSLAEFSWYHKERPLMVLHDDTAAILDMVLEEFFAASGSR
jgi:hypothetical protein|nr:DUF5662 family protein [Neorhizobium tomejilense]